MSANSLKRISLLLNNIRRTREGFNYSQEYMARQMNISQNAYAKLELGYTRITLKNLLVVADLLSVSIDNLLEDQSIKLKSPFVTDIINKKEPANELHAKK